MPHFHRLQGTAGWGSKEQEIARLPLFEGLTRSDIRFLTRHLEHLEIEAGTLLTMETGRNETFWVVSAGALTVSVHGIVLRTLERGDFVGGHSFIHGGTSAATVVASTDSRAFVASREQFRALRSIELVRLRLEAAAGRRFYDDFRLLVGLEASGLGWLARTVA